MPLMTLPHKHRYTPWLGDYEHEEHKDYWDTDDDLMDSDDDIEFDSDDDEEDEDE